MSVTTSTAIWATMIVLALSLPVFASATNGDDAERGGIASEVHQGRPPFSGTIYNFPKLMTDDDPSALREVVFVDALPKTPTGKIQRFALRAPLPPMPAVV